MKFTYENLHKVSPIKRAPHQAETMDYLIRNLPRTAKAEEIVHMVMQCESDLQLIRTLASCLVEAYEKQEEPQHVVANNSDYGMM